MPSDAVVQVADTPVSMNTFDHWMRVAAASEAQTTGATPTVPVPPDYTACIANLKAHQTTTGPTTGEAELKSQCEQQYKSYKDEVMSFLISSEWVIQEAKRLGVHATDKEVVKELEKLRQREFPKEAEFKKFLATSGETISDLLLRVKIDMLGSRIEKKVTNGSQGRRSKEVEHVLQPAPVALRQARIQGSARGPHEDRSRGEQGQT